jgi:hypothetical protein
MASYPIAPTAPVNMPLYPRVSGRDAAPYRTFIPEICPQADREVGQHRAGSHL